VSRLPAPCNAGRQGSWHVGRLLDVPSQGQDSGVPLSRCPEQDGPSFWVMWLDRKRRRAAHHHGLNTPHDDGCPEPLTASKSRLSPRPPPAHEPPELARFRPITPCIASTKMQRILLSVSLLASAAVGVLASDDLKIDVTLPVECERKTQKGDTVNVHYRGTLQSNGEKFDASESARVLSIRRGPEN